MRPAFAGRDKKDRETGVGNRGESGNLAEAGTRAWAWLAVEAAALLGALFLMGAMAAVYYNRPYHTFVDCRGKNVTVETIKQIKEREKGGYTGLLAIAGWSFLGRADLSIPSMGRNLKAPALGVYGSFETAFPEPLLSGTYGGGADTRYCLLTGDLAFELFGSVDVAGAKVWYNHTCYLVAGVLDKGGRYIMLPMEEGEIEQVELLFDNRKNQRKKIESLGL